MWKGVLKMANCENLKVGDFVFVNGRFRRSLHQVEKITPKGFIKVNGSLYTKRGWVRGGDSFAFATIQPASAEEIEQFRKEKLVADVIEKMHSVTELSYEKAVAINGILFDGEQGEK